MKIEFLAIALFSYIGTYLLVPWNIRFSNKLRLLDKPTNRGIHSHSIPLAGGLSFGSIIISAQLICYLVSLFGFYTPVAYDRFLKLALGGFLILILGLLDDERKFTAKYKLLFQILIACLMYFLNFKIALLTNPFGNALSLEWFSFPITVIWYVLIINAFNLIDGLDGLASGIATITTLILFVVGIISHNIFVTVSSILIFGANLAFLKYNFYPARIFMGDTGSLFLGFNIASITIAGTEQYKGITSITLIIPLIVLVIPLADTLLAVVRRVKKKVTIFDADKEHIHHKLLDYGLSQKTIALISYFITFLFGLIALGFSLSSEKIVMIIFIFIAFILLAILYFIFLRGNDHEN